MNRRSAAAVGAAVAAAAAVAVALLARRKRRPIHVSVGTTNKCKLAAVRATLADRGLQFLSRGIKVETSVADQPLGLESTMTGARARARAAYFPSPVAGAAPVPAQCDLALGLESGVFEVDGTMFDVCCCCAYDGKREYVGWSTSWALPGTIAARVRDHGEDLSQASNSCGLTKDPRLGEHQGCIGILSLGRITRKDYTMQAIDVALIGVLDSPEWYKTRTL